MLPTISIDKLEKPEDFLKFLINSRRTQENWKNLGAKIANYFLDQVDESLIIEGDDESLKQMAEQLLSPVVLLIGITAWMNTDPSHMMEILLLQQTSASEKESNRFSESESTNSFIEGLQNAFAEKWPRLMEL